MLEATLNVPPRIAVLQTSRKDLIESHTRYDAELAKSRHRRSKPPARHADAHTALNNHWSTVHKEHYPTCAPARARFKPTFPSITGILHRKLSLQPAPQSNQAVTTRRTIRQHADRSIPRHVLAALSFWRSLVPIRESRRCFLGSSTA